MKHGKGADVEIFKSGRTLLVASRGPQKRHHDVFVGCAAHETSNVCFSAKLREGFLFGSRQPARSFEGAKIAFF